MESYRNALNKHKKNVTLCLRWPGRHTSCIMLFLLWQLGLRCRLENWVRNGLVPKSSEHLLVAHQIHRTCESNPSSEPVRVRKPSGKQIRLSLMSLCIAMGTVFFLLSKSNIIKNNKVDYYMCMVLQQSREWIRAGQRGGKMSQERF